MDRDARKCLKNWVITLESTEEQHQEIILSTIAKRAHQMFEERGCKHGFELDDWLTAEQELFSAKFDGNTSVFHVLVDCPRDPEVTTILSGRSLTYLRANEKSPNTGIGFISNRYADL
jgi:hypothetical protein